MAAATISSERFSVGRHSALVEALLIAAVTEPVRARLTFSSSLRAAACAARRAASMSSAGVSNVSPCPRSKTGLFAIGMSRSKESSAGLSCLRRSKCGVALALSRAGAPLLRGLGRAPLHLLGELLQRLLHGDDRVGQALVVCARPVVHGYQVAMHGVETLGYALFRFGHGEVGGFTCHPAYDLFDVARRSVDARDQAVQLAF